MVDFGLSSQQLAVICALSNGATIIAGAAEAGVHRNTVANWHRTDLSFKQALAQAQYDRALYFREKMEALADLAAQTLSDILADPNAPASVRLKAALAVLQTASTPPQPKKQVEEKLHNDAQPQSQPQPADPTEAVDSIRVHSCSFVANPAHNPAQRQHTKIGRNEPCPCGSGAKYKRCCLNKPAQQSQAAA